MAAGPGPQLPPAGEPPAHVPLPSVPQPRPAAPAQPPRRRWPPRAILNALMSLAVVVLEWRIRKALRSGDGTGRRPG